MTGPFRQSPGAVIVAGPPASGKTVLARRLADELQWMIADLDAVTGPLTQAALALAGRDETAIDDPPGLALRAARYEALLTVTIDNLHLGAGVVLAAPFTAELADPTRWSPVARRLRDAGAGDVLLAYVDCPPEVRAERGRRRGAARDAAKPAPDASDARELPRTPALIVDGTAPVDEQVTAVLAQLTSIAAPVRPAGRSGAGAVNFGTPPC